MGPRTPPARRPLSWLACCTSRDAESAEDSAGNWLLPAVPCTALRNRNAATDDEEDLEFFECAETENQLAALLAWRGPGDDLPFPFKFELERVQVAQEEKGWGGVDCFSDLTQRECTDLAAARAVLERTREQFSQRVGELRDGGGFSPELEWAKISAARRMLKANLGDVQKAVDMFIQALEFRARDRKLFQTMRCEARFDIRVIARDLEEHPAIYMCARSQTSGLRSMRDQIVVTFEAACKLTSEEGTVVFMVDMHGLRPHLNMDFSAIKDLADTLGTIFAERIFKIIIVDFSRAAQTAWWMLKPMLRPATRAKLDFVSRAQAEILVRRSFGGADADRIIRTFEVNRDRNGTEAERALHARRTTLCDVPLGPPLA